MIDPIRQAKGRIELNTRGKHLWGSSSTLSPSNELGDACFL